MKATNKQILSASEAFRILTRPGTGIRGREAFRLSMLVIEVEPIIKAFYDARKTIADRYAEKNKKTGEFKTQPKDGVDAYVFSNAGDEEKFLAEIAALVDTELEIKAEPLTVVGLAEAVPQPPPVEGENAKPAPAPEMWEVFRLLGPFVTND